MPAKMMASLLQIPLGLEQALHPLLFRFVHLSSAQKITQALEDSYSD